MYKFVHNNLCLRDTASGYVFCVTWCYRSGCRSFPVLILFFIKQKDSSIIKKIDFIYRIWNVQIILNTNFGVIFAKIEKKLYKTVGSKLVVFVGRVDKAIEKCDRIIVLVFRSTFFFFISSDQESSCWRENKSMCANTPAKSCAKRQMRAFNKSTLAKGRRQSEGLDHET